jgi:hypothetical protein
MLLELPETGVLVVLAGVIIAEVALLAAALVDLLRRPDEGVAFGRRWVWFVIVLVAQVAGPVAYFAFGRRPWGGEDRRRPAAGGVAQEAAGGATASRAEADAQDISDVEPADASPVGRVVDLLYGPGHEGPGERR